ncbi:MAG: tRNA (adenosine(37)-N6)-threonylcarbamoyltransferase complex ATPase subunit type 1 TsaE [Candidatus Levyibacteriota bacterium]
MQKKIFITKSAEETQKIAKSLVRKIKNGGVLALYGDLGSGKTTFTQGLAKELGIKRIISPTFIIIRSYKIKNHPFGKLRAKIKNTIKNSKIFYHIDLYRVERVTDVNNLGIEEIFENPQNIIVIEWAEKMKELLPKKRIDIYFEYLEENKRKIEIMR